MSPSSNGEAAEVGGVSPGMNGEDRLFVEPYGGVLPAAWEGEVLLGIKGDGVPWTFPTIVKLPRLPLAGSERKLMDDGPELVAV